MSKNDIYARAVFTLLSGMKADELIRALEALQTEDVCSLFLLFEQFGASHWLKVALSNYWAERLRREAGGKFTTEKGGSK